METIKSERDKKLLAKAEKYVASLINKGVLTGRKPENIGVSQYHKNLLNYIKCIFIVPGGQIFYQDKLLPGNRFKTKMTDGRFGIWSIISKTKEQWKWDTCHEIKAVLVELL